MSQKFSSSSLSTSDLQIAGEIPVCCTWQNTGSILNFRLVNFEAEDSMPILSSYSALSNIICTSSNAPRLQASGCLKSELEYCSNFGKSWGSCSQSNLHLKELFLGSTLLLVFVIIRVCWPYLQGRKVCLQGALRLMTSNMSLGGHQLERPWSQLWHHSCR